MKIRFDPAKRLSNLRKHGIDLIDTDYVFGDPIAVTRADPDHDEARYVSVGRDARGRLLVVVWTDADGDNPRVISARRASPRERKHYYRGVRQ